MADAQLRTDSVQVTPTRSLSPNSPARARSGSIEAARPSDSLPRLEAPSALSAAMQRAVADYIAARDHLNSLTRGRSLAENDRAEAAYCKADDALIATPADNLHDLRAKFDALWCDPAATPHRETVLAVFADFRRLTDGAASTIFNPETWLHYFERRGGAYVSRGDEVFLLQPNGADLEDLMFELEALGGKSAVVALIRQRCAQEADHR